MDFEEFKDMFEEESITNFEESEGLGDEYKRINENFKWFWESIGVDLTLTDDDYEPNPEKLKLVAESIKIIREFMKPGDRLYPIDIFNNYTRIDILLQVFNIDVMDERKEMLLTLIDNCDMFCIDPFSNNTDDGLLVEFTFNDTYVRKNTQ